MIVNHVEVREVKPGGAMKASVRLFDIVVGTFRKKVSGGYVRLYLPGGTRFETADGSWKTWEPIKVFYEGKFVNKQLRAELLRLSKVWWERHKAKTGDQVSEADAARTEFADRPWTEPFDLFVRPLEYVDPETAEKAGREWDAGKLEIVLREGDFDAAIRIPVRRRNRGLEASMPKWTIGHSDIDVLGNTVESTQYAPRLHFQAGGHYIDGQVLGAAAVLWAMHFRVHEPLIDRRGRCASCRFLEYHREELARDRERPVEARWFCRLKSEYIDDQAAVAVKRAAQEEGMERAAWQVAGSTRFVAGCEKWSGRAGQADFKRLLMVYRSRPQGRPIEELLAPDHTPTPDMLKIKAPIARFVAEGFTDPDGNGSDVPDVPVTVRLLVDQQAGKPAEKEAAKPEVPAMPAVAPF